MLSTNLTSNIDAVLLNSMGDDIQVLHAARVSTGSKTGVDSARDRALIKRLITDKHGSPFEHGSMTFLVKAPLFVWREHMRHRIGFSYNEESARYKKLERLFYVPDRARTQNGKAMDYQMSLADAELHEYMLTAFDHVTDQAYRQYERMLERGIAREVARMVLPVNIMSNAYVTCNPRSLMNFLELRLAESAQYEIRLVAQQYDKAFARHWPMTHAAFHENGRVAP